MNVLFIGNSYTYYNDLERLFEQLSRQNGKHVNAYRITQGGRRLLAYMDMEDETTQQLERILRERRYDVCFIQEQSLLPAEDFDSFLAGLTHVLRMVGGQADQKFLYATWARKVGSEDLETRGWTPESMTALLSNAYRKAANEIGATVSPVGEVFWKVICEHPEINLHNADLSHPSYQGSCLAALTHYYTLFGEFPKNTSALSLSTEELEAFRSAVCP